MKTQRKEDVRKIEEAIIRSFRHAGSDAETAGDSRWTTRVMARVREENRAGKAWAGIGLEIPRTVWRFAAATCLVALLMAAYVARFDSAARNEVAELSLLDMATDVNSNFMEVL